MAFDYAQAQRDADELIREFGPLTPAKLIRGTTSGGSRFEPGTHGTEETPCMVVVVKDEDQDSGTVRERRRQVIISALDPDSGEPITIDFTAEYKLEIDGTPYEIALIEPLDPSLSAPVIYTTTGVF